MSYLTAHTNLLRKLPWYSPARYCRLIFFCSLLSTTPIREICCVWSCV